MEQSEIYIFPNCDAVLPNSCMLPVFVPLHDHILTKLEELQQEIEELKQPAPSSSAPADDVPEVPLSVPPAAWPANNVLNQSRPPDLQVEIKEDISTRSALCH